MASPLQSAPTRRKLSYLAVILVLLGVSVIARGVIPSAAGAWSLAGQSERLEMNELDQGEAELTGSAVRLLLTGSRGLAVCSLWISAQEKQKRHEWNELELIVNSITKLQPHFIVPWQFQSWNLAYNVSVEMDRLNDMYFYIARGIQLGAEGETLNKNSPDLRYAIAFYFQNKFSVSDKVNTLRCLYELSCVRPDRRDPRQLLGPDGKEVDPGKFLEFCREHPQLVRRLREAPIRLSDGRTMYLCQTPADVVRFLRDNEKVPSRFRENRRDLAEALRQFPVFPPAFAAGSEELNPSSEIADDRADAFLASRAWFRYSLVPLPPPDPVPGPTPKLSPQQIQQGLRIPKQPMLIIFRQGVGRSQTYLADRLEKEGWFGETDPKTGLPSGWKVDANLAGSARWFPQDVELLPRSEFATARRAWADAREIWRRHGEENGLYFTPAKEASYTRLASEFARRKGVGMPPAAFPPELRPDELGDEPLREGQEAHRALWYYHSNRQVTNFPFFLVQAIVESEDETLRARRLFFEAERFRSPLLLDNRKAIQTYEQAFAAWKDVLAKHPEYLRDRNGAVQEESFEKELRYLQLIKERDTPAYREAFQNAAGALAGPAAQAPAVTAQVQTLTPNLKGPLAGLAPDGKPWVDEAVQLRVKGRLGLVKAAPPPKQGPGQPPPPPGPARE